MIIKNITITNFLSYYGENSIDISPGLTLVIGDNGDGKTSFFDAHKWLLDTTNLRPMLEYFSAKRKADMLVGDTEKMSVSMTFEHHGEKYIEKSFNVTKTGEGNDDFKVSGFNFSGYAVEGTERNPRSGESLVNGCFDAFMQKFSMFKGESQLDVLDDATAFSQLIEKYSDLKDFETVVGQVESFASKSYNALLRERQNDKKTSQRAAEINQRLEEVINRATSLRNDIRTYSDQKTLYNTKLETLEKNQEASEKFNEVEKREASKRAQLASVKASRASVNLNTSLLDRQWVLCAFPNILQEFHTKVASFAKLRRQIEKTWTEEYAAKKAKNETLKEVKAMLQTDEELRWDIPDQQTMEEMIEAEQCWVCGHRAPKGSPEYDFMVNRLNKYKARLNAIPEPVVEEEKCFETDYCDELRTLSIQNSGAAATEVNRIANDIKARLASEVDLDGLIRRIEQEIEEMEEEKARILVNSEGLTEELIMKNISDYMGLTKLRSDAETKLSEAKIKLEIAEKEIGELKRQMAELPGTGMVKVYNDVNNCFEAIAKAFKGAKEANLTSFLENLENTANKYQTKLNAADFSGVIRLRRTTNRDGKTTAEIELRSLNGDYVHHKSGSQETTMYMSVLFAISELTTIGREENYPLLFDAPTSPFGNAKAEAFYNIVDKLDKQCIIVTKDFINDDSSLKMEALNNLTCKIYRIKKAPGYVQGVLSTIKTDITEINR